MSQARTARRRRKQMSMNNAHLSGMGVPRYGRVKDSTAKLRRIERDRTNALKEGRTYGFGSK